MGELITDEMLNAFGVTSAPGEVVGEIKRRYGDFTSRTSGGFGFVDKDEQSSMIAALRA